MSKQKYNQAYIDAWMKRINNQDEEVILIISQDNTGSISLNTVNELSQDKIKELLYQLARGLEPNNKLYISKQ